MDWEEIGRSLCMLGFFIGLGVILIGLCIVFVRNQEAIHKLKLRIKFLERNNEDSNIHDQSRS